ncbi:hypothetical protein E2C01_029035 [Portunus trituberculatus]|uniref:Uncharacterized protein n=1 Tax=Portunus trituberculatus TaxID=210409 RepID=A0A5B7EM19_PORTR|nr:hypothetical protein [Portunus trituberculatus]
MGHDNPHRVDKPAPGEAAPQQSPSACSTALLPRMRRQAAGRDVSGQVLQPRSLLRVLNCYRQLLVYL